MAQPIKIPAGPPAESATPETIKRPEPTQPPNAIIAWDIGLMVPWRLVCAVFFTAISKDVKFLQSDICGDSARRKVPANRVHLVSWVAGSYRLEDPETFE